MIWTTGITSTIFVRRLLLILIIVFLSAYPMQQVQAADQSEEFSAPFFSGIDMPGGAISSGEYFNCALKNDGSIRCWGYDGMGQSSPPSSGAYAQISAGSAFACAVRSDGRIVCWGNMTGSPSSWYGFVQVSAGNSHTCGLKTDSSVQCWGGDFYGQATPPSGTGYTQVSAGEYHTCALREDGSVECWGANTFGMPTTPGYSQIGSGYWHTCAIRNDGRLDCWGDARYGRATPPSGTGFSQVSSGWRHSCALRTDGSVTCWGDDSYGQSSPPAGTDYRQISTGARHSCALRADSSLVCWGSNGDGQAGPPSGTDYGRDSASPAVVSIQRTSSNPSSASSVSFTTTFNEFVTGVDSADFSLDTSGTTGAAITSFSGSGSVYTITVGAGSGDGTIRLDLSNDGTIRDAVNLSLAGAYSDGQAYTVDGTSPTVSISSTAASPTGISPIPIAIDFSENVTGFSASDVVVSNGSLDRLSGSGSSYVIDVVPSSEGFVTVDIPADAGNDAAGNGNTAASQFSIHADQDLPEWEALTRISPVAGQTNADTIVLQAVFSEDVRNVDAADFTVSGGSTAAITTVNAVTTREYNLTLTGGDLASFNGIVGIDLAPDHTISDLADKSLPDGEPTIDETYFLDNLAPSVSETSLDLVLRESMNQITISFGEDVFDPEGHADTDDVSNPANYLLLKPGTNGVYDTVSCSGGLRGDDPQISVDGVGYDSSTTTATLDVNHGVELSNGSYRLLVCGTTSILDLSGNTLGNGADFHYDFAISIRSTLPETGFPMGRSRPLPELGTPYASLGALWLEIPRLDLQMSIVGVDYDWDVTWLGEDAGWLEGTAFPTHPGNTVLAGHVWNADNTEGPFVDLNTLHYGDAVVIHNYGHVYTYEVRENRLVSPDDFSVLEHEDYDWLTLLTCQGYDRWSGAYAQRRVVRAVLVEVDRQ